MPAPRAPIRPFDIPGMAFARLRRPLADRARPRGAILLYHRIAAPRVDTWDLSVSPARFAEQLDLLAASYTVLPLGELVRSARARKLPDRAVAITFDDGYVDNLTVAVPELEQRGLPATVFVATGYVGGERPFWWDELEDLMLGAGERPDSVVLELLGHRVEAPTRTLEERRLATHLIQPFLRKGPADRIEPALLALRSWAGRPGTPQKTDGRCVTHEELHALATSDVIAIGAHTRSHPGLAAQPPADARAQVVGSRDDLAAWLGSPPSTFSYPLGDSRPATRRIVRRAGFELAVSVAPEGPVTPLTSRFSLPRQMAFDEDPGAFEARLEALLDQ